jgi:hypothetical protein
MGLQEKRWWKNIFSNKEHKKKVDVQKDISAIIDFLQEINDDQKSIITNLRNLKELETEFEVAKEGIVQVNLQTQAKLIEKIIQEYEFLQNDVDINGLRVKMITEEFLKRLKKAGMHDLLKEKRLDPVWKMQW